MIQHNTDYVPKIEALSLFPEVNKQLITLLKSLKKDDWDKPSVLPGRTVKDLASHILDTSLRRLSMCRDNYQVDTPNIESYEELVHYIQKLNSSWIEATRRLSPQILISFLEISEPSPYEYLKTLAPNEKAKFSVAWAGQLESQNWFDIAREYTEKWHHQMQIRLAVNRPGINSKEFFYPAIDTFMRGLPHAYKDTKAASNTGIQIHITGSGGGFWFLERIADRWLLVENFKQEPETKIEMTDDLAWQIFTDSISREDAVKAVTIMGNRTLANPLLIMKTVMR